MSDDRWQRLRARTFRWNDGKTIEGYLAAEVVGDSATFFAWSHTHGEGRREMGTRSHAELVREGAPVPVPAALLEEILRAMEATSGDALKGV